MERLFVKRMTETALVPAYQTEGAAGLDLHADFAVGFVMFDPGMWCRIRTGIAVQLPAGHVGLVQGRSGNAFNRGWEYYVGTIDEDYRGEISVLIRFPVRTTVKAGDRIAQLVVLPVAKCFVVESAELGPTRRGQQGYGSTGV